MSMVIVFINSSLTGFWPSICTPMKDLFQPNFRNICSWKKIILANANCNLRRRPTCDINHWWISCVILKMTEHSTLIQGYMGCLAIFRKSKQSYFLANMTRSIINLHLLWYSTIDNSCQNIHFFENMCKKCAHWKIDKNFLFDSWLCL